MRRLVFAVLAVAPLAAGGARAETDTELNERLAGAMQATNVLVTQLTGALKQALEVGGPVNAIAVCRDVAPTLAYQLSTQTGWKVTRVGTRVRDPLLGSPDAFEQKVLMSFAKKLAMGDKPDSLVHAEVVNEPQGRFFRFMKGLPTGEPCLSCHGVTLGEDVRAALATGYPKDKATGYLAGDLRGAVSIKQKID